MEKSIELVLEFGEALHSYGAASYNLEQAMHNISKTLGLEGEFFSTPTLLISSFTINNESKTFVRRVYPTDVDLRKLSYLDALGDKLIEAEIDVEEAYKELKRIRNLEDPFKGFIEVIAFGIIGICASIFFNAGFFDIIASGLSGLVVGIINVYFSQSARLKNFNEFLAAFVATLFAIFLSNYYESFNLNLVIIASTIVLIPGLSLTISMTELATLNLASGTARLMQAILNFFKLAFGVAMGLQVSELFNLKFHNTVVENLITIDYKVYALLFAALAFSVLFKISLRYYFWILLVGAVGFFTTYFLSPTTGVNIATFIAGFSVCLIANAFARFYKKPTLLLELPGLILIVPGSVGFKGIQFFFEKNTLAGIDAVFDMFLIAVALVSGFLLANILLVPNRSL